MYITIGTISHSIVLFGQKPIPLSAVATKPAIVLAEDAHVTDHYR